MNPSLRLVFACALSINLVSCGGGGGSSSNSGSSGSGSGSTGLQCSSAPGAVPGPATVTALSCVDTTVGTGPAAVNGNNLTVNYTGWVYSANSANYEGTQFDSSLSANRMPFQFTLGAGQVIAGWDQGLLGMHVGGTRTLIIPSSLAYGANSPSSLIPANSALVFTVTLVSIP